MSFYKVNHSFDPIKAPNANIVVEFDLIEGKVIRKIFKNTVVFIDGFYSIKDDINEEVEDISILNGIFDGNTSITFEESIAEMYELKNNNRELNFEFKVLKAS